MASAGRAAVSCKIAKWQLSRQTLLPAVLNREKWQRAVRITPSLTTKACVTAWHELRGTPTTVPVMHLAKSRACSFFASSAEKRSAKAGW